MKYTIGDVRHLIPESLTEKQAQGIEAYLNEGTIPPADPCQGCEPNLIRKYINRVQKAEREGQWPPTPGVPKNGKFVEVLDEIKADRIEAGELSTDRIIAIGGRDDLDFSDSPLPVKPEEEKPKAAPRKRSK